MFSNPIVSTLIHPTDMTPFRLVSHPPGHTGQVTARAPEWGGRADARYAAAYDASLARDERDWLAALRGELLGDLHGDVLELGAGTGLNRHHFPAVLTSLTLLEPSPHMRKVLESAYGESTPTPRIVPAGDEELGSFAAARFDAVVATFVLCSVPDQGETLRQIHRILRPQGTLVLIEHVRGEGLRALAQTLVSPLTARAGNGCRHDRDTAEALHRAGFDVGRLRSVDGPRLLSARPVIAGRCPIDR